MKKILLFFGIIAVAAMMTSCLEGNNSFTESSFVFIDRAENNVRHGRTSTNISITSPAIRDGVLMTNPPVHFDIGSFYFLTYRWDEENDFTSLGENTRAHNVQILGTPITIPSVWLADSPAPEQLENMQRFAGINPPLFSNSADYWRDNWILQFNYVGGETPPMVALHKRERAEGDNADTINIDVRIVQSSSTGGTQQERATAVSFDMSRVRESFGASTNVERRKTVNFYFYQENFTTPQRVSATWVLPRAT